MGKFALANLFVVMLLVLFGCSKSQQSAETVTLAVTGMA